MKCIKYLKKNIIKYERIHECSQLLFYVYLYIHIFKGLPYKIWTHAIRFKQRRQKNNSNNTLLDHMEYLHIYEHVLLIYTNLKLCLATETHNFNWVKIIYI